VEAPVKHSDDDVCPYSIQFSDEEDDALEWLQDCLVELAERPNPYRRRAQLAIEAIKRTFERGNRLHNHIHEIEVFTEMVKERGDRVMN
jgi:hypothetical protein